MTLTGIKIGDIVRADQQHCHVLDVERGALRVQPIGRSPSPRTVKAREVEIIWKKAKR